MWTFGLDRFECARAALSGTAVSADVLPCSMGSIPTAAAEPHGVPVTGTAAVCLVHMSISSDNIVECRRFIVGGERESTVLLTSVVLSVPHRRIGRSVELSCVGLWESGHCCLLCGFDERSRMV